MMPTAGCLPQFQRKPERRAKPSSGAVQREDPETFFLFLK